MKISKTAVLIGGFLTTGLGLTCVSGVDLYNLKINEPDNLVQHITGVKIIESGNAEYGRMESAENLVNIETNNFVLSKDKDSNKITTGNHSSILGGSGNTITGDYSVIVGGENNKIEGGISNSILGGMENRLKTGENSVIIGGENNTLEGSNSSIVGGTGNTVTGDYLVVVGNNSHVTGSYSVVMGQNSNLNANSSFLWTDGGHAGTFTTDNVFAVIASGGMVINATRPHNEYTQLTLGGPLVLSENIETNSGIVCSNGQGGGIVKVVNSGDKVCMCSCDGYERSSLFGLGTCRSVCNPDIEPKCNTGISKHWDATGQYNYYSGGCDSGNVVDGAYFVDKYNVVHWSCQSDDGAVVECTGSKIEGGGKEGCGGEKPTGDHIIPGPSTGLSNNKRMQWEYVNKNPSICQWSCEDDYERDGTKNECKQKEYQCKLSYPSNAVKTGASVYYDKAYTPQEWTSTSWIPNRSLAPCYFACPYGYLYDRSYGSCVDVSAQLNCLGDIPPHAEANDPNKEPKKPTEFFRRHEDKSSEGNSPCTYHCVDGYEYDWDVMACVEKKQSETHECEGPQPPEHSKRGSNEYTEGYPTTGRTYTGYTFGTTKLQPCFFTCKVGYVYEDGKCVKSMIPIDGGILEIESEGTCTGDLREGEVLWDDSNSPSIGEVEYFHSSGYTSKPCAFHCDDLYSYDEQTKHCETIEFNFCNSSVVYGCIEGANPSNQTGFYTKLNISKVAGLITFKWYCKQGGNEDQRCGTTKGIACNHCAKNGFPYCFPIDFSADCNEVKWWEAENSVFN